MSRSERERMNRKEKGWVKLKGKGGVGLKEKGWVTVKGKGWVEVKEKGWVEGERSGGVIILEMRIIGRGLTYWRVKKEMNRFMISNNESMKLLLKLKDCANQMVLDIF